jgi:hypothetical protein
MSADVQYGPSASVLHSFLLPSLLEQYSGAWKSGNVPNFTTRWIHAAHKLGLTNNIAPLTKLPVRNFSVKKGEKTRS